MNEFDSMHANALVDVLRKILDKHAKLLMCTKDPLYMDLINLCRRCWIMWGVAGLLEVANGTDNDPLALEVTNMCGELEAAIVDRADLAGFNAFVAWARQQIPDYSEPPYLRGDLPDNDNDNVPVLSAEDIEGLEREFFEFFEFKGLTIGGDVAFDFVEDVGILCDKLTELQAELWPLKSGTPRLAAFAEKLDIAAEHALDLHRVAVRAAGGRIIAEEAG
jgi:hypothetical protein